MAEQDRAAACVPLSTPDNRVPGRGFIVMCRSCYSLARSGVEPDGWGYSLALPKCCGRTMSTTLLHERRRLRHMRLVESV